jgi:hypothetical protein
VIELHAHHKDTYLKEIEPQAQNMFIIVGPIMKYGGMVILSFKHKERLQFLS